MGIPRPQGSASVEGDTMKRALGLGRNGCMTTTRGVIAKRRWFRGSCSQHSEAELLQKHRHPPQRRK